MTTSAGSSITLRVDRHPFDTAEVGGVGVVDDVSRTGSASTRMYSISEQHTPDWGTDVQGAVDRRRSFAAMSPSRLSSSPPTIEDIEVDTSDEDDDDEEAEERKLNIRLLSRDIEETLRGDVLYLEEPMPVPTSTADDCSPLEELDRVPTLQTFSPAEDWRRRRKLASALRYSPLYRCYSTNVDPWSYSSPGMERRPQSRGQMTIRVSVNPWSYPSPRLERRPQCHGQMTIHGSMVVSQSWQPGSSQTATDYLEYLRRQPAGSPCRRTLPPRSTRRRASQRRVGPAPVETGGQLSARPRGRTVVSRGARRRARVRVPSRSAEGDVPGGRQQACNEALRQPQRAVEGKTTTKGRRQLRHTSL